LEIIDEQMNMGLFSQKNCIKPAAIADRKIIEIFAIVKKLKNQWA